jgi:hypothetical protein
MVLYVYGVFFFALLGEKEHTKGENRDLASFSFCPAIWLGVSAQSVPEIR